MTTILLLFAALGAHLIFNQGDVFAGARAALQKRVWLKFLWCPECNIFWIGLGFAALGCVDLPLLAAAPITALAFYPIIWAAHKAREHLFPAKNFIRQRLDALRGEPAAAPPSPLQMVQAPQAYGVKSATPTPAVVQALIEKQAEYQAYVERVVIMTGLTSFEMSYSLTGVICDQARMLARDTKRRVEIWVVATCNFGQLPTDIRDADNIRVRAIIPAVPCSDDLAPEQAVDILFDAITREMIPLGAATIITHDLLFQTGFSAHAKAIHRMAQIPGFRWYHQCHSGPSARVELTGLAWCRTNLPEGHKLICVSPSQAPGLATQYGVDVSRVRVVPNARDPRGIWRMPERVSQLISLTGLMSAALIQVLPVSATRLEAKGLDVVLRLFGAMRSKLKAECRLIVAVSHANADAEKTRLAEFRKRARAYGMLDEDLIFTSEMFPETETTGLPGSEVQALFRLANVFIFPSGAEACSLVTLEAALAGNLLVLNDDVPSMKDIIPVFGKAPVTNLAIYYPFLGQEKLPVSTREEIITLQAGEIIRTLAEDRGASAAIYARTNFNYERIGAKLIEALSS